MAINPLIALSGRPVEMPNFAGMRAQMLSGNAIEQDMALKQAQVERDLAAQQQMREMLGQLGANPTPEQRQTVIGRVAALNPKLAGDVQKLYFDAEDQKIQLSKNQREADAAAFKNDQERTAAFANIANSVLSAPEPQRMEAYQRGLQVAVQRGLVKPEQAQQMASLPFAQVAPYLQALVGSTIAPKDQQAMTLADAAAKRDAAKANREQVEFDATIAGKRVGPDGLTPNQRVQRDQGMLTSDRKDYLFAKDDPAYQEWLKTQANLKTPRTTVNVNSGQKTIENEMALRKEAEDQPAIKAYRTVTQQLMRAEKAFEQASKGGSLNAVDQVLITTLNKILDPGSVVRESEYARTAEGQAMMDRLGGALTRLRKGGAGISDDERRATMQMIRNLGEAARMEFQPVADQFRGMASSYGLNPDRVVMQNAPPSAPSLPTKKGSDPLGIR